MNRARLPLAEMAINAGAGFAVVLVAFLTAVRFEDPFRLPVIALVIGAIAVLWMLSTHRHGLALVIVMVYLGVADGFLKLHTGEAAVTLARDALLYACAVGVLIRHLRSNGTLRLPPLGVLVVVYVLFVGVQVLNPASEALGFSVAAARQHLEFVPLFFLGYALMRDVRRLEIALWVLLAIAAVNGVVGLVQFDLAPAQLAAWGPGYERLISGTGDLSARVFYDSVRAYVRPPGLGGDLGFGGLVGMLAVPAALALMASRLHGRWQLAALSVLSLGTLMAIATSQQRAAVVGAVLAVLVFLALSVDTRRLVPTIVAVSTVLLLCFIAVTLAAQSSSGTFSRLADLSPRGAAAIYQSRDDALVSVPQYLAEVPLGAGLGTLGPASGFGGRKTDARFNGESLPSFLVVELGVGAVLFLGFFAGVGALVITRLRRLRDPHVRTLVAAFAAPFAGVVAGALVNANTTQTPVGPFVWFAAGVLVYWLTAASAGRGDAG